MDIPGQPCPASTVVQLEKTFHLQNHHTKTMTQHRAKIEYIPASRTMNITPLLNKAHSQGVHLVASQIFYENMDMKMYHYLGNYPSEAGIYLPYQYCSETIIRLKYKRLTPQLPSTQPKTQPSSKSSKEKAKCRSIGEVQNIVRKWRELSQERDQSGAKKYTLMQAAEMIGVRKKTLDDYSYQIQFGLEHNFDFGKYKHDKIGLLRSFVRDKRKELCILNNTDNYWADSDSSDESNK